MGANILGVALTTTLVTLCLGCAKSAAPLAPSTAAAANDVPAGGSSLKAGAPTAQSPINDVTTSSLTPTFVATGVTATYSSAPLQYRFRVADSTGTVTADSGLLNASSWALTVTLTPTSKYTWRARRGSGADGRVVVGRHLHDPRGARQ